MRAKLLILTMLAILVAGLTACGTTATPAPSGGTTPAAATTASQPAGGTPLPLPAQPTLPPVAPRQATPFVAATTAPIVSVPVPTKAATAAPTAAAGQPTVAGQPTAPQPPASGPTAPGVATGQRVELKLEFVKTLVSAEEVDEIAPILKAVPGIISVTGNEVAITVLYDPGLILPNQIRLKLASMGHPVKE